MMKWINILSAATLLLSSATVAVAAEAPALPIVPRPLSATVGEGRFTFSPSTTFGVENEAQLEIVGNFAKLFAKSAGFEPAAGIGNNDAAVVLTTDASLGEEAYSLSVKPERIEIKASSTPGFFYALQSLRQLLPSEIEGNKRVEELDLSVPSVEISDAPRFGYRGLMLDPARHFIPKNEVLRIIDIAAMLKLNVLHFHLVDDTGWRLEIKKYPKLMQVGAWRVDRDAPFPERFNQQPGEETSYGGYYSQDDIRDIVAYAAERQIEVIPEIEMPAHTTSSLAAYPELACPVIDYDITVLPGLGGVQNQAVYCAGNDKVFEFLEDVIDEVVELFPSEYIHLGGDEASKRYWKECPKCQERMKKEGIPNEEELQGYFMRRMSEYVQSKGRKVLGWDELTNATLPKDVTILGWQGYGNAALKAAAQGHEFIMTPARVLYLIRYQGPQWFEPLTYFGNNTLLDVYNYEPVQKDWKPEYEPLLKGIQASLWNEFCTTPEAMEHQLYPRLLAMADVAWTPKGTKDWEGFLKRIDCVIPHIKAKDMEVAGSMFNLDHVVKPENGKLAVSLSCIRPDVEIRYTLDGSEPTASSKRYDKELRIGKSMVVKAATFANGEKKGQTLELKLDWNKATACPVTTQNDKAYVLTNGLRGSQRHSDFEWAGWYAKDAEFVLDLKKSTSVKNVTLGCVNNSGMGVSIPAKVRLSVSNDNRNFHTVKEITYTPEEIFRLRTAIEDIVFDNLNVKGRYLKFEMTNPGISPKGTFREGQNVWMYFDEIIVK